MKKIDTKKQLIIILTSLLFFLFFLLLVFNLLPKKEKPKSQIKDEIKQEKIPFEIKSKPQEGEIETILDNIALTFIFSKEIDKNSIFIQIKPDTDLEMSFSKDGKGLTVYPKERWIYDQHYLLEIELKSKEKDDLEEKIYHRFKLKKPKNSPMDESKISN